MDTRDGTIYTKEALDLLRRQGRITAEDEPYLRQMGLAPTPHQRTTQKVGRNDPCPCGSQRKFKKCCLGRLPNA
jgi:preprotein translocase subunit SecA